MDYHDTLQAPRRLIGILRDRYAFLSILGRGGSGTVYEVKNLRLGRVEALKALTNSLSLETTQRFTHEAKVSALLDHPGIVKVYDFGQTDDINWYSMQLIEGPSLSTLIEEGIRLDPVGFSRLAIPLLDALAFSHAQGIIHRDIKPGNIMLHKSGRPCLTDFGIAKSPEIGDFTQTGNMVGTPAYMSPEQAEGKRVDGRTDQYSLAITLYRAVSGRLPFSSMGTLETLVQRLKEDPDPLEWYCPDFPAPLRHILMKALSRNREDRYNAVADMQNALQHACEAARIQWGGPLSGFEHLSDITRRPIETTGTEDYDDAGATAVVRSSQKTGQGAQKKSYALIFIGFLAFLSVIIALFFLRENKTGQSTHIPPDNETDTDTSDPPEIEYSFTPGGEVAPKSQVSPEKPQSAPTAPVARNPVSPPRLLEDKVPDNVTIPPGLAGRLVRVRLAVGEDGRVSDCVILDTNMSNDEKSLARIVAMNMIFSPALADDGKPTASDIVVVITF